jgi:hypothetical protein
MPGQRLDPACHMGAAHLGGDQAGVAAADHDRVLVPQPAEGFSEDQRVPGGVGGQFDQPLVGDGAEHVPDQGDLGRQIQRPEGDPGRSVVFEQVNSSSA